MFYMSEQESQCILGFSFPFPRFLETSWNKIPISMQIHISMLIWWTTHTCAIMEGMMFNPQYTAVQQSNNIPLPSGHLNACPQSDESQKQAPTAFYSHCSIHWEGKEFSIWILSGETRNGTCRTQMLRKENRLLGLNISSGGWIM